MLPEDKANELSKTKPEDYWFKIVWMTFLIAYPSIFTFLAFLGVWLDGERYIEVPPSVLITLIVKTAATDIGVISYVTITRSLFPNSPQEVKALVE